jgi:pyruvate dehydrogenase E2 component (dihydrolipoamide acetyltransferase)
MDPPMTQVDPRIQPVTMPKWGLSMKSGKVTEWLVAEGDTIEPGMDLADIETDKIAGTLESAQDGVLRRIVAQVGADVPVSGVLAVVAPPDVPDEAVDAVVAAAQEAAAAGAVAEDTGPTVATVQVGEHTISYAALGERTDGADVVVLVHGFGGDKNSWLFVQEPLVTGGATGGRRWVLALDLPGHGESSKAVPAGTDLAGLGAVVIGVLDALGIDRAHLVGHSLGGAVVAAAAAAAPDRAASLTLIAPAGFGPDADADYLRSFAAAASRRDLKPLLGRLFADPEQVTRQLVDDVLKYKRLDGVDAALQTLLGVLIDDQGRQRIDTPALLAAVQTRRTVVWGLQDGIMPPGGAAEADDLTRVVLVEGAGHMVHMETPQPVLTALEATLDAS